MSSILLIQSDPVAASRLTDALGADPRFAVCASVGSLREARDVIAERVPDLLLTDMRLPDGPAYELLRELRPGRSHVMVVTASFHDPQLMHTLRMGTDAFIPSGCSTEALLGALRQTLAGESPVVPEIARQMLAHFDALSAKPVPAGGEEPPPTLSAGERNLLEWAGEGYGAGEIALAVKISAAQVGLRLRALLRRIHFERRTPPALAAPEPKAEAGASRRSSGAR
ncbi:MAG TPA: response regulator transcription factor [Burkholderiaceae bacterium]|jgi:DNA-binding NarL/FixJ family response regulator